MSPLRPASLRIASCAALMKEASLACGEAGGAALVDRGMSGLLPREHFGPQLANEALGCTEGVLGHPSVVAKSNLQRHTALQDPPARLGGLQAGHDALEQDSPPEPIEAEPGLCRPVAEALLQGGPERR